MGGGPELKEVSGLDPGRFPGGWETMDAIMKQQRFGLDPEVRRILESQGKSAIGGAYKTTLDDVKRTLYSRGGTPAATQVNAQVKAGENATNAMSRLYQDITMKNEEAKDRGFNKWAQFSGLELNDTGQRNQYNLEAYKADQESRAAKGQAIGSIFGSVGSVAAGKFIK